MFFLLLCGKCTYAAIVCLFSLSYQCKRTTVKVLVTAWSSRDSGKELAGAKENGRMQGAPRPLDDQRSDHTQVQDFIFERKRF